jgi:hypothetical protein
VIRKIILGNNPKDAMAYFLGMSVGGGKIVSIQRADDVSNYAFDIYIEDEQGTMLWKQIINLPTIIEYDCKF